MTIYLIRHAEAGAPWPPLEDADRPLTPRGQMQAEMLATNFAAIADSGVRVLSSAALRCISTVTPLADQASVIVEQTSTLSEAVAPDKVVELIDGMLADRASDVVLCSHGNVIPEVLRLLMLRGTDLRGPGRCEKGSIWAIDLVGNGLRASYIAPPC